MTHYEILEIGNDSSNQEIKKAYFKLIRKYNPEKHQEKFMEIRSAYETLIDDKTRKEYDQTMSISPMLRQRLELAVELKKAGRYKQAIDEVNQIIMCNGESEYLLNELGQLYIRNNQLGKASNIYENLIKTSPQNASFWAKLAECYLNRGWRKKGIEAAQKAFALDEDNISLLDDLVDAYMGGEQFSEAKEVIQKILDRSEMERKIQYYYMLVKIDFEISDYNNLLEHFAMIADYGKYKLDTENYEDVENSIKNIVIDVVDEFKNLDPERIINIIKEKLPKFKFLNELEKYLQVNKRLKFSHSEMLHDYRISEHLKEFIDMSINNPVLLLDKEELKQIQEDMVETFKTQLMPNLNEFKRDIINNYICLLKAGILINITNMKKDLVIVKREYPLLYEEFKEFFDLAYESKNKRDIYIEKCMFFNDDISTVNTFERNTKKIGRNDPCPCGSGKKYKRCCGA